MNEKGCVRLDLDTEEEVFYGQTGKNDENKGMTEVDALADLLDVGFIDEIDGLH